VVRPDGNPAKLDPNAAIEVDKTGEIHQNGQTVGRFATAEVDDAGKLSKLGNTYFKWDGPAPGPAKSAELHQGALEAANVPVGEAAVRLVSVMRQFEMLQRAMSLGNDMGRRAIDEVAKVS
jgi:flagellar basal body rod protein FlgG